MRDQEGKAGEEVSPGKAALPAVELVWVLLPSHVEVEAQVCVYADTEVVVHEEYRRCVLVCVCSVCVIGKSEFHLIRLLLIRVKDDRPPAQKCPQLSQKSSPSCST